MDEMMEIARLISNVGFKQLDFLFAAESQMMSAFFDGLVSGEFENDEIAAQKLYKSSSTDARYRQLKSRMREKLYEASVFINFAPPKFSTLRQKMYDCYREQIAMKQCIENGAQEAGYSIAKRLLIKARKYHLTIVEIECLYTMLTHVIFSTGNEKEYMRISEELRFAQQKLNAETESEIIFGAVSVKYAVVNADHPENAPFIEECIRKIEEILVRYDTFKIRYSYYLLRSWLYQSQRNFKGRIQACDDAIEYCKQHPDIAGNLIAIFSSEKADCYFHLRDYDSFLKMCSECELLLDKNTSNWLILKSYEVQTLLSTDNPIRALEVFTDVRKTLQRSSGGLEKFSERWLILEGYIYFFLHTQPSEQLTDSNNKPLLAAYLRKLVTSEFKLMAGDKEGANVGKMILHILLLLSLKSSPVDIAEKIVALDRYKRRYLDQGINLRTETFITMLRHFIFESFDMFTANTKTEKLFLKLSPTDKTFIDSTEDYELVPFDLIWRKIMQYYGVTK